MGDSFTRYCSTCGAVIGSTDFCQSCGADVHGEATVLSQKPPAVGFSSPQSSPSSTRRRVVILMVSAALVCAFVAVAAIAWRGGKQDGSGALTTPASAASSAPTPSADSAPDAGTASPSVAEPAATGIDVSGSYDGVLAGNQGHAPFLLHVIDRNGRLRGTVEWSHTLESGIPGTAGTETVSGVRAGRKLSLSTMKWSQNTASDWVGEHYEYRLRVVSTGGRLTGKFRCYGCGYDPYWISFSARRLSDVG